MSFDAKRLAALIAAHGPVVRVVVAETAGSAPRDAGASVTVWADGQEGTIGGGTLEFEAVEAARTMLANGTDQAFRTQALGPDMGQCCGGRVRLLWERYEAGNLPTGALHCRPVAGATQSLRITRTLARARDRGDLPKPGLIDGWMVEPVMLQAAPLWIWGAGHVGRALVAVMAPLPDVAITWVDTGPERFPDDIPEGVTALPAPEIVAAAALAPKDAHHIILTYSHALDLGLCNRLLTHGFASLGLIGSDTKWVRFQKRLAEGGHTPAEITRITCPIGDRALGKHPAAIALGVGSAIVKALQSAGDTAPAEADTATGGTGT